MWGITFKFMPPPPPPSFHLRYAGTLLPCQTKFSGKKKRNSDVNKSLTENLRIIDPTSCSFPHPRPPSYTNNRGKKPWSQADLSS